MKKLPKSLKKLNRKELQAKLLEQMNQNIMIVGENYNLNRENVLTKQCIESAENALLYKDRIIEKYKSLLDHSIQL